jgi:hypothetical protein
VPADTITPPVRAAVDLARTLRSRGLVAAESAGIDGAARVLVFSRSTAQLAEQVYVVAQDGKLWFCRSDDILCPAADIATAADAVTHLLAAGEPA